MRYIASINDLIISLINRPKGRVKSINTNFIVRIVDGSWSSLTQPSILGFKPNRPLTFTSQPDVRCDTDFQLCRLSANTDKTRSLKTKDSISKSKKKRKRETTLSAYATFSNFSFFSENEDKCDARNTKKKGKNKKEIKTAKTIMLKVRAARAARIFVKFIWRNLKNKNVNILRLILSTTRP